jgi:hypothetical protein
MDYLNLDTREWEENANTNNFINYQYIIKVGEELLNDV